MTIKNYTSTVPISRTIARIEECLAKAGASGIMKDYADGRLTALCFKIRMPNGRDVAIRLPADEEAVYRVLEKAIRRPRDGTVARLREQAQRTAWKLQQDFVEVQLSLIQMQQTDPMRAFLAYVWDGTRTFYDSLQAGGFKMLPREQ